MKSKYEQAIDGQWLWPKRRGYKTVCCDCGLVHRVNYKLEPVKRGRGVKILYQAYRDERATAQMRRYYQGRWKAKV